ncbi:hypothetical protein AN958_08960 [Leucoagaricus sp. SymC.cos]|nr:hypothetical protein AN958_08960 [Leucoagaricus sp. SymC.cos]
MSASAANSPSLVLWSAVTLVDFTTINGVLYGFSFALYCLSARSLYLQSKDPDSHPRQKIVMLIFTSLVMALGLVNLAGDTRGVQLSFVNYADRSDPHRKGLFFLLGDFANANIGLVDMILMIVLESLLMGIQAGHSSLSSPVAQLASQVWRLWIIWNMSRYSTLTVIVPGLALLAFGALQTAIIILPLQSLRSLQWLGVTSESLNVFVDIVITVLIIGRIIAVRRHNSQALVQSHSSSSSGNHYTTVIAMLVESFGLLTLWQIGEIVTIAIAAKTTNATNEILGSFLEGSEPYIRLPPDEQPFFKFTDLLNEILNRLDHFYLAIVSAEDKNPFPEALQLLQETRANAAAQASLAYRLVFTAIQFARNYLDVLGVLMDENPGRSDIFGELAYGAYYAGIVVKEYGKAEKEMAKFGQETVAAVKKIPQMLNDSQGGESKKREFLTAENTQVVSDLLRVISAYATVIRECLGYYKQMEKHLTDLKEAGGPCEISEQEAQLVLVQAKVLPQRATMLPQQMRSLRSPRLHLLQQNPENGRFCAV